MAKLYRVVGVGYKVAQVKYGISEYEIIGETDKFRELRACDDKGVPYGETFMEPKAADIDYLTQKDAAAKVVELQNVDKATHQTCIDEANAIITSANAVAIGP